MGWNYLLSFNDVSMGDALRIEIDAATGHVFMIGPAVGVLQGEIALADRERSFNKMQIRTAVPTDLQEIVKIEAECFPAAEAATKVSIAERLAVYPNHFWVQLDGDRMIGFVNGMVTDDPDLRDEMYEDASLHNENGAWQMIFGVDTIPEYRCRGCAAALLNHVIGEAKAQGRKGLVLTCKDKLVHYYAKFGFVSEGVSGSTHGNVVWYQMRLRF